MNLKGYLLLGLKLAALTIIKAVLWSGLAGALIDVPAEPEGQTGVLVYLLGASFLNTIVLAYPILRSRWSGLKLIVVTFFLLFGIQTFLSQIETLYLRDALIMPLQLIWALILVGALLALVYSPLAVLILGKIRKGATVRETKPRLVMPWQAWAWKSVVLAITYVCLYLSFGYFVAWQNPELRQLYSGSTEILGFFTHMRNLLLTDPWLVPLQVLRAWLWVALALPVIQMMKGRRWEAALSVGLLFAILMNSGHLLPNPFMPDSVRLSHFVETASSNFIFGGIVVWVVSLRPGPPRGSTERS